MVADCVLRLRRLLIIVALVAGLALLVWAGQLRVFGLLLCLCLLFVLLVLVYWLLGFL